MAHALAAFIDPVTFPMTTAAEKRAVTPRITAQRFAASAYSGEPLGVRLSALITTADFGTWSDLRNILAHRISPARNFYSGGPQHGTADWLGLGALGPAVTQTQRQWLSGQLASLVEAAAIFTHAHL